MKFKKSLAAVLSLTALFSMSTALVGCKKDKQPEPENPPVTNDDETIVQSALDSLTVKSTVTEDFTLAIQGAGGVTISWSSANVDLIKIVGANATVVRPTDKDTAVELTATATLNSVEKTKKFTVTVTKAVDTSITIAEALAAADDSAVEIKGVVTSIVYVTSTSESGLVFGTQGYWVSDSTGSMFVYGQSEVVKGNLVSVKGTKITNVDKNNVPLPEIKNPEATVLKDSEATPAFSYATEITLGELKALTEGCAGKVYKIVAAPYVYKNTKGGYVNFELLDADENYINEYANTSNGNLDIDAERYEEFALYYDNHNVTKVCYFAIQGKNSKGTAWRGNLLAIEDLPADQQAQNAATSALSALADKYNQVTEVALEVGSNVEITVSTNDYVTYADGKIKITALPAEAVEVTVTAKATVDGVSKEVTKKITVEPLTLMTIEQALAAAQNAKVLTKGTISVVNSKGYVITDGSKGIYVHGELPADYKVGDVVEVNGTKNLYYKGPQIIDAQLTKLTETASANPACVAVDAAKITSYVAAETQFDIFMGTATGKYVIDSTHRNIVIEGSEYTVSLDSLSDAQLAGYDEAKDQTVVVEGWVVSANTSVKYVSIIVTKITLNGTELVEKEPTIPTGAITIAEALALADDTAVIVRGTVKSAEAWSDSYNNMSVTITDGTNDLYVYRLATKVNVGDKIEVSGKMATYKTRQIAAGATATFLPLIDAEAADQAAKYLDDFAVESITANKALPTTYTSNCNTNAATITWTKDGAAVTEVVYDSTINADTTVEYIATIALGTETIQHTVTFKLISSNTKKATLAANVTANTNAADLTTAGTLASTLLGAEAAALFTVAYEKGGTSSELAVRTDGIRMYANKASQGNKLTITAAEGSNITITSIKVTYLPNYSATAVISGADGTAVTGTFTGDVATYDVNSTAFTILNDNSAVADKTNQVRFTSIEISYVVNEPAA